MKYIVICCSSNYRGIIVGDTKRELSNTQTMSDIILAWNGEQFSIWKNRYCDFAFSNDMREIVRDRFGVDLTDRGKFVNPHDELIFLLKYSGLQHIISVDKLL